MSNIVSQLNLTLSESAQQYIRKCMGYPRKKRNGEELVDCLTYCGGGAPEKDGKILWTYSGPNFLLAREKATKLRAGDYFDVGGFRFWITEMDQQLLKGRTLTVIQYGNPDPEDLLVIENAPEDYLQTVFPPCRCNCKVSGKGAAVYPRGW